MSMPRRIPLRCPKCGTEFETTVFESLNTNFDPNVIDSVISGERFTAKCPHCGAVTPLEYELLYHDMINRAMIWVLHPQEPAYETRLKNVRETTFIPYDVTRIVPNINYLRDKAACLKSGKDDRVIELCKLILGVILNEEHPDFAIKDAFYTCEGGKSTILFYDWKHERIGCDFDDQVYNAVATFFGEPLSNMEHALFSIIDAEWAIEFYHNYAPDRDKLFAAVAETLKADSPVLH